MAQIKDTLRMLRSEQEAKQSTIAEALGLAQGTYSSYENGITPPMETCIKIAKHYNISLDYLLGLSNERRPAGGLLSAHFTELAQLAGAAAPTASDIDALLIAAAQYYRKGAPCGDIPLNALHGFLDGLQKALSAAASSDNPGLILSTNDAVISALEITKMPAAMYGISDK